METSKQGMEGVIKEEREQTDSQLKGQQSFVVAYLQGLESVMLDHVFASLEFHLQIASRALSKVSFTEDKLHHFHERFEAALVFNCIKAHNTYLIDDEYFGKMLKELQQALMPTLKELVSSLEEEMDQQLEQRILIAAHGIMGSVEAIYSTYYFSRAHAFEVLDSVRDVMNLPFDTPNIRTSDHMRYDLDWSELNTYSYRGEFPYNHMLGAHIFTEAATMNAIYDLFQVYDDDFATSLEVKLLKDVGESLLKIGRVMLLISSKKKYMYEDIEAAIGSFEWLHFGVGETVEKIGQGIDSFTYRSEGHFVHDRISRIDSLFTYYEVMFKNYVYEMTGVRIIGDVDDGQLIREDEVTVIS